MTMRSLIVAGLAAGVLNGGWSTPQNVSQSVTLRYENGHTSRERIRIRQGSAWRDFDLALFADRDVQGSVLTLTVELTCLRCEDSEENYMYGGRPWHGLQPFMFAAHFDDLTSRREFYLPNIRRRVIIEGQRIRTCRSTAGAEQICAATVPITLTGSEALPVAEHAGDERADQIWRH
jgi:hypothetical protein